MNSQCRLLFGLLFLVILCSVAPAAEPKLPSDRDDKAGGPRELTKEEAALNDAAKAMAKALFDAKVWDWDVENNDIETFAHYRPTTKVKIADFDTDKREYLKTFTERSGAEYRYALTAVRAYGYYEKLDDAGKKILNKEIFGQETRPEKGTDQHKAGLQKALLISRIVAGEVRARPVTQESSSEKPSTEKP